MHGDFMSLTAAREYLASPHLEPELKADLEPLREQLESSGFKSRVRALGGYDTSDTGQTRKLAG